MVESEGIYIMNNIDKTDRNCYIAIAVMIILCVVIIFLPDYVIDPPKNPGHNVKINHEIYEKCVRESLRDDN
jgi:hypothetical protein